MAREKADYRANLARLEEEFPNMGMLTVDEVARWLKVDRHTVTALIKKKRLPAVDVGLGRYNAKYRVSVESLARFSC